MGYAILIAVCVGLLAASLYFFLKTSELSSQFRWATEALEEKEVAHASELAKLEKKHLSRLIAANEASEAKEAAHASELAKLEKRQSSQFRAATEAWKAKEEAYTSELAELEKLRHIPDVIERARKMEEVIETKLVEAHRRAYAIVQRAVQDAQERSRKLTAEAENLRTEAQDALQIAEQQAQAALEEARQEAKDLASKTRKDTKEKREKTESALAQAIKYASEIRLDAYRRAKVIAGDAFHAQGRLREYEALARALENRIEKYESVYMVPATHVLDELAEEFGFNNAGVRLKLARQRTTMMQANGTAATCEYPDGWKKDHALKFVLGTFNGKVDTVLSRLKPGNQGKLIQEIKDAYALVNRDGEVYKNARIQEEYLDSRLEEVKWGVAVLRLKEKSREEQRAIREQIREEQRAKKEIEKAIKQAEREEELVNKAIAKLRKQLEEASEAEKVRLEIQLLDLNVKLAEAEEKGKKAISMAQQTKQGHVYIISNLGSFGENVYKIGLTRRVDPTERVRELGDASVPFPFDVHAMLKSEDAPALETALHRRFVERQVNKVNKRKEYFKVSVNELKDVVDELGIEGAWTMECEASQYRETLALEEAMRSNATLRKQWLDQQATFNFDANDFEDADEELEEADAEGIGTQENSVG